MPLCSAFQCKNNGTHRFPAEEKRRNQWIDALHQKNWKPTSSSRLCRKHFKPNDFYDESRYTGIKHKRQSLKKEAVPTLFIFSKQEVPKSKRQLRHETINVSTRDNNQTYDDANRNKDIVPASSYHVCTPDLDYEMLVPEAIEEANVNMKLMSVNTSKGDKCTQINIKHICGSLVISRMKRMHSV